MCIVPGHLVESAQVLLDAQHPRDLITGSADPRLVKVLSEQRGHESGSARGALFTNLGEDQLAVEIEESPEDTPLELIGAVTASKVGEVPCRQLEAEGGFGS